MFFILREGKHENYFPLQFLKTYLYLYNRIVLLFYMDEMQTQTIKQFFLLLLQLSDKKLLQFLVDKAIVSL